MSHLWAHYSDDDVHLLATSAFFSHLIARPLGREFLNSWKVKPAPVGNLKDRNYILGVVWRRLFP